ncbi:MAG: HAD family hydrolase [Armatimonadetes bacterium]|nr:HAD family hydrolase [Armatimonadota bacterium]
MNPFTGVSAVLFDLDGTLIDTHIDFALMRAEMLRLATEYGLCGEDLAELDILAIVGECRSRLARLGRPDEADRFRALAYARLRDIEVAQCADPVEVPGACDVLERLRRAGVRVGIVTRNCRDVAEMLVRHGRLECDALVTRDDVERTKPDPEHLHAALEAMWVSADVAPASCRQPVRGDGAALKCAIVMVGDHWMDVLAGTRAGCRTVGLLRGRSESVFGSAMPDTLAEGVADLLPMLDAAHDGISRRTLIATVGVGVLTGAAPGVPSGRRSVPEKRREGGALRIETVPSYCTHEHWGSVASFGMEPEGFRPDVLRGAKPQRRTGLTDILIDPYFGGWLAGAGVDVGLLAREAGLSAVHGLSGADVGPVMRALRPAIAPFRMTGGFEVIRRGVRRLHGYDLADCSEGDIARLDERIAGRYGDVFGWYAAAMREGRLVRPIRPVHPEFFWRDAEGGEAEAETKLVRPILRIDPLLQLHPRNCPRRDALAALVGTQPADAPTWRRFLSALFDRAAQRGCVGIKQLQAYSRNLDFSGVPDADVQFVGPETPATQQAFGDWLVHECCKLAHDRGWPHQVHVGTHNLPHSNPLPLARLAQRYRRMRLVLLHCWPFLTEAGWLAWQHPNVYLDGCWMPVINPACLREALERWLGLLPHTRVMCGHDAASIEMAVGSVEIVRSALDEYLQGQVRRGVLREADALDAAHAILHGNAERLYEGARPGVGPPLAAAADTAGSAAL